jgi:catechol 2,3-dioxygenase-like lactoylglutathione lyase family enzyme
MSQDPIRFLGRLILCLAGCASYIFVGPISVFGEYTKSHASPPPKIDHILLEVSNLAVSIRFYRDFLGLHLKSRMFGFAMLESGMSVSSFGAATGIGKNRARAANAEDWESIPISKSVTQLRSSTKRGKRVIESSRIQENMVGVPKHSSLTLTVTFGHLCLRQSEPGPLRELQATTVVLKNRRGVNSTNLVVTTNGELRTYRNNPSPANWQCVKKSAGNYVRRMNDVDHDETILCRVPIGKSDHITIQST